MRTIILTLGLTLLFGTHPTLAGEKNDTCANIAKLAASMMEGRQDGVSLEKALSVSENVGKEFEPLIRSMVIAAYEIPRYGSPKYMQRAVEDFRDQMHLTCLKSVD